MNCWRNLLVVAAVGGTPVFASDPAPSSIGANFRLLEAGEFRMGTDRSDELHETHPYSVVANTKNEQPAHRVRITKPFEIAVHEVTVGEFRKFVEATKFVTDAERTGGALGFFPDEKDATRRFHVDPKITWQSPGFEQTDAHPVVCVSWNDAVAFCDWLSKKESRTYRLPTEVEWEYACRAGTETIYSFGDDPNGAYAHANVGDGTLETAHPRSVRLQRAVKLKKEDGDGFVYTAPVGSKKPNPWGLHDLHGNVWEWTADRYAEDTYELRLKGLSRTERTERVFDDPPGVETTDQHEYGDWRVIRGGSWFTAPLTTRSAMRTYAEGSEAACYTGFRIVRVPSAN